eukprot:CAMPEP_0116901612 /NCGR_PEP_ID=MMETSP0467-20121206/9472_1 /TAXON_ID=283647 /ORGANISM="Mesodinium pulex, Strain SPMC105" /LENGTH=188 /DNA_ID=CAMNT_0004575189 /DNA_START=282 /DNA_END=848 /DNA_ORIENTATION=+
MNKFIESDNQIITKFSVNENEHSKESERFKQYMSKIYASTINNSQINTSFKNSGMDYDLKDENGEIEDKFEFDDDIRFSSRKKGRKSKNKKNKGHTMDFKTDEKKNKEYYKSKEMDKYNSVMYAWKDGDGTVLSAQKKITQKANKLVVGDISDVKKDQSKWNKIKSAAMEALGSDMKSMLKNQKLLDP